MQAVFFEGNRTLRVGESVAVEPGAGQVRIRVAYCGICGTDLHLFHGAMAHRLTLPHVMGHEMSGTIAALGSGVAGWREGDRVTVRPLDPCGHCPACLAGHSHICHHLKFLGIDTPGALQGMWTVPAHTLHRLPETPIAALGSGVAGWREGDRVTVRPLDPCGHCPACLAGHSHICHHLKFLGIDTPGALQGMWTVPACRYQGI